MALRQWSSEIYTAEFRELQASTFCCSRDGRLGLLAGTISSPFHFRLPQTILDIQIFPPGRRSLGLLCMEQPNELVRRTARSSRWLFHFPFLLLTFVCANKFTSDGRWALANGTQASSLETTSLSAATTRRASMFFMLKNNLSRKKIW